MVWNPEVPDDARFLSVDLRAASTLFSSPSAPIGDPANNPRMCEMGPFGPFFTKFQFLLQFTTRSLTLSGPFWPRDYYREKRRSADVDSDSSWLLLRCNFNRHHRANALARHAENAGIFFGGSGFLRGGGMTRGIHPSEHVFRARVQASAVGDAQIEIHGHPGPMNAKLRRWFVRGSKFGNRTSRRSSRLFGFSENRGQWQPCEYSLI
jgi:hypothetical protein